MLHVKSRKPSKLILHISHHKAGIIWFSGIFGKLAKNFNWKFNVRNLNPNTDLWMSYDVPLPKLDRPYVGSHMIRDPRDIIVSGYFYHIWCNESWCLAPNKKYGGISYQEFLKSISKEEGIIAEIRNCGFVFGNMLKWDYNNPNILEIKYEDIILNQEAGFRRIFEKYGFVGDQIEDALKFAMSMSFTRRSGRPLGAVKEKSHLRSGLPGDWKNHFTDSHINEFKKIYPKILGRLGYSWD
jgi:hypothetical protein